MSAVERITGRDWAAWMRHVIYSSARGAALAVKSSGAFCTGAVIGTGQWQTNPISLEMIGWAALSGFLYAFCDAIVQPPTGNEVNEKETP